MYDHTVHYATANEASLSLARMISPKIEPEIVLKIRSPLGAGTDAAAALEAVDWIALGFEIIDCPYADWKYQPADLVAAYGLHAALIVGEPHAVTSSDIAARRTACKVQGASFEG
jgi:2-keto-4-pentenoate hydratase